jgi:hypothetical protein
LVLQAVGVKILENGPEEEEEEEVVESYLEWVESGRIGLNAWEQMGMSDNLITFRSEHH